MIIGSTSRAAVKAVCPPHFQMDACVTHNRYCHYVTICDQGQCTEDHLFGQVRCCMPCCLYAHLSGPDMPYCEDVDVNDIPCNV